MLLFSKKYKESIQLDYSRTTNIIDYEKGKREFNFSLQLSFLTSGFQKQQKTKIKSLCLLELFALQKAFFVFVANKSKRKLIFVPSETRVQLTPVATHYFLYNFSKNVVGSIKDLPFFIRRGIAQRSSQFGGALEASAFGLVHKNIFYFNDLHRSTLQSKNYKRSSFKGFYRL